MPESLFIGWVNITGMEGQHKTEWWVNMLRNLQYGNISKPGNKNPIFKRRFIKCRDNNG